LGIEFIKTAISAVQSDNKNQLIEFFCRQDIMEKLVTYTVAVPTDPSNESESYKYVLSI